jgi:hypothetical protein
MFLACRSRLAWNMWSRASLDLWISSKVIFFLYFWSLIYRCLASSSSIFFFCSFIYSFIFLRLASFFIAYCFSLASVSSGIYW